MDDKDLRAVAEEKDATPNNFLTPVAPDSTFIGIKGQQAFADFLGIKHNPSNSGPDGGVDFILNLIDGAYTVDVKTSRMPHLGMLCRVPLKSQIYAFVDANTWDVIGWQWSKIVKKHPIVDMGHGFPSHNVPVRVLRNMDELRVRLKNK